MGNKSTSGVPDDQGLTPRRGTVFEAYGYSGTEMRIGNLSFGCVDFGGFSKLNTSMEKRRMWGKM